MFIPLRPPYAVVRTDMGVKGPDTVGEPRDKFSLYYYKAINILD